jgi:hypothetical protein
MATIVYKTWSTSGDEIDIYCHDDGVGVSIICHTGVHLTINYEDVDDLIKYLQDFRKDKE